MNGKLFSEIVFGPIKSRRLGSSLGINLLPTTIKYCTLNCVYCECGWTDADSVPEAGFYKPEVISHELEQKLIYLKNQQVHIDSITFSGNGEPTTHPDFCEIIDRTIAIRDKYIPDSNITVLSNSTMIGDEKIRKALMKINNLMKLDAGSEKVFEKINMPKVKISLFEIVENLKKFEGQLIIQSMFVKGIIGGEYIDNTSEEEVQGWLKHIQEIKPKEIMIYSLDRRPPLLALEKIEAEELSVIADKCRMLGFNTQVY
jgi:wyosine [tRNA(Phe)-imidazoG37] synthetase (radical SAM superfamily)